MSIDINVNVSVELKTQTILEFFRALSSPAPTTEQAMKSLGESLKQASSAKEEEPISYEEHLAKTAKTEAKAKKTKVTEQAVEEAKAIIKPAQAEPQADVTPNSNPDYSNITKDEIRALATEMQAHQGLNIRAFLDGLGYANISGIPAEKYPEVYALLKKEEVNY